MSTFAQTSNAKAVSVTVGAATFNPAYLPCDIERCLIIDVQSTDQKRKNAAAKKLIASNIRYLAGIASRYYYGAGKAKGVSWQECVHEMLVGYVEGINRFDISRKNRLTSYASWFAEQRLARFIDLEELVHLPVNVVRARKDRAHVPRFAGGKKKKPQVNVPAPVYSADDNNSLYLPMFFDDEHGREQSPDVQLATSYDIHPVLDDACFDIDGISRMQELKSVACELLRELECCGGSKHRMVLEMRYGIGRECEMTFTEIGKLLGVSRERIRQIHNSALEWISKHVCTRTYQERFMSAVAGT